MKAIDFKERVKNIIILEAKNYKNVYVDYDYLICSKAFSKENFYLINAKEDNFQHLTGVNTILTAREFYNKALDGTLNETDFNFLKRNQSEKSVKGSVRRKIKVLPNMMSIFEHEFDVQEHFIKNHLFCDFVTSDKSCTIGFKNVGNSIPISLLTGCKLDKNSSNTVDLVLSRKTTNDKFDKIIIGDMDKLTIYYDCIKDLLSNELIVAIRNFCS